MALALDHQISQIKCKLVIGGIHLKYNSWFKSLLYLETESCSEEKPKGLKALVMQLSATHCSLQPTINNLAKSLSSNLYFDRSWSSIEFII